MIYDDASPDRRSESFVRELAERNPSEHQVFYARREQNVGFPANMNGGFAAAGPADVVILNSDCVVADGWLAGLRDAAYSDSTVATATALTNHGSAVSVPGRPGALPQGWTVDQAAAAVRTSSLRIRPRLPTAIGHCVYVRRTALDLVGDFDLVFSPGYGEEVDFSQRALQAGMCHVVADDVFVLHHGSGSFSEDGQPSPLQDAHEQILKARYPYYHDAVHALQLEAATPLTRALGAARRALSGLSVLIDARILDGATTGTHVHVVELIGAVARTEAARLTVLVPDRLNDYAKHAFARLPGVRMVGIAKLESLSAERFDLVHRPYQIQNQDDLTALVPLADRLVITHQDLIAYHNPAYFTDFEGWQGYRWTTRTALAVADRVVFFSHHARRQALEEDLIETDRARVIHIGVDHESRPDALAPLPPLGHERLPDDAEAIICIGTDFRHKNRLFALHVLDQLQQQHGWGGYLLLVGPTVACGSSSGQEDELLAARPRLAEHVIRFSAVSENEKEWLYQRSRLAIYPTVYEGFGLVPFEAADHGVPCIWAAGTSLSEVLPDAHAGITAWDPQATASRTIELLRDGAARDANLAAIRAAAAEHTWTRAGAELVDLYNEACDGPAAPGGRSGGGYGLVSIRSGDAVRLVGPEGVLPKELERPLLALATHRQIGWPLFAAIKVCYRAAYALRRLRLRKRD